MRPGLLSDPADTPQWGHLQGVQGIRLSPCALGVTHRPPHTLVGMGQRHSEGGGLSCLQGHPSGVHGGVLRGVGGPLVLHAVHGVPERVLRTEECSMPLAPSTPERERERERCP